MKRYNLKVEYKPIILSRKPWRWSITYRTCRVVGKHFIIVNGRARTYMEAIEQARAAALQLEPKEASVYKSVIEVDNGEARICEPGEIHPPARTEPPRSW